MILSWQSKKDNTSSRERGEKNIQNEFLTILEGSTCSTIMETNSAASIFFAAMKVMPKVKANARTFVKR